MKIEYQETTNDLATRIDIHSKYGSRDIDKWMIDLIQLQPGMKILDVGCGAGKQCFSYFDFLNGKAEITGGDVNHELLEQAKKQNSERKTGIRFLELDFNKKFDFPTNSFAFCSCCFAIYYALDVPFTIGEMHRILKPGGRLFTTGPMPENKQLFYEIIKFHLGDLQNLQRSLRVQDVEHHCCNRARVHAAHQRPREERQCLRDHRGRERHGVWHECQR